MKILLTIFLLFYGSAFAQSQDDQLSFSLERQGTSTVVILHSVKKFPCRNYLFDFRDYQNADTTIFTIRDFLPPMDCSGPKEIAEEKYIFSPSTKRFYLQLRYKGKRDMWRIFQQDTTYLVRPERASFTTYVELKK